MSVSRPFRFARGADDQRSLLRTEATGVFASPSDLHCRVLDAGLVRGHRACPRALTD